MDDAENQARISRAVGDYIQIENDFKAERAKALGSINERQKALQAKVITRIAKLDLTKEAFYAAVTFEQHARDAKGVFGKLDTGEDLNLAGGFSRILLATGTAFRPLHDEAEKEHMTDLAEELLAPAIADDDEEVEVEGGQVVNMKKRERKTEAA